MLLTKLKMATAVLAGVIILGAGVLAYESPGAGPSEQPPGTPAASAPKSTKAEQEKAKSHLEAARANVDSAAAKVNEAEDALRLAHQQLERAQAEYQRLRLRTAKDPEKPAPPAAGPKPALVALGTLNPASVVQVTSGVAGRVAAVGVQEGDMVKAGQVLATLDASSFRHEVERAKVRYEVAYARVEEAKAGQPDETAKAETGARYRVAYSEAKLAHVELARAEAQLEMTTLRAPIDGVVTKRQVEVGDTVGQPATRLFELIDPRLVLAAVAIPEGDIGRVFPGQRVRVEAAALPGTTLEGKVARIAPTVDRSTSAVMVHIALRILDGNTDWKPGMSVRASFQAKE